MVLRVYGFATQIEALRFEWKFQHPLKSTMCRDMVKNCVKGKIGSFSRKMQELRVLLHLHPHLSIAYGC